MNTTFKKNRYVAFGLNIFSDLNLPELTRSSYEKHTPDLIIRREDLYSIWQEHVEMDPYYIIKENFCMVRVPYVGLFKIEGGKVISYSPLGNANDDQIRLYVLGTCLGVALMQRKVLPMHGSCIAVNGKAYAIVGDSGAGKSTLASVFIDRGFPFLTDDVIAVTLSEDNIPFVTPSYPQQKLWQDSLKELGMESHHFHPIYDRETKFAVPHTAYFIDKPMPLAGVFVLRETDQQDIEITPVKELERFSAVYSNTYRNFMLKRSGLLEWHFNFSAKMINSLLFYLIRRPRLRFTANEIADRILYLVNQDEINSENTTYQKGVKVR